MDLKTEQNVNLIIGDLFLQIAKAEEEVSTFLSDHLYLPMLRPKLFDFGDKLYWPTINKENKNVDWTKISKGNVVYFNISTYAAQVNSRGFQIPITGMAYGISGYYSQPQVSQPYLGVSGASSGPSTGMGYAGTSSITWYNPSSWVITGNQTTTNNKVHKFLDDAFSNLDYLLKTPHDAVRFIETQRNIIQWLNQRLEGLKRAEQNFQKQQKEYQEFLQNEADFLRLKGLE